MKKTTYRSTKFEKDLISSLGVIAWAPYVIWHPDMGVRRLDDEIFVICLDTGIW